jgi:bifunctional ADP-heptose synthase (sugar kinase/adenylyltransferase)
MDTPQQKRFKVLLIGDSCEDEYIYGRCERISPEAPVPVMNFSRIEKRAGMAENVFYNLRSFGLTVSFLTNSEQIVKTRFIDEKSNQQILRVDKETRVSPLNKDIDFNFFDAIVISDYNKGFLTKHKLFEIVESTDIPIFIDSKKTHLPNKENCFIKINDLEYSNLNKESHLDNLIVTKGSKGSFYKNKLYPAEMVNVYDVVGAGDTFISALVYGYLSLSSIEDAIILANKAAAIAVQHPGTYVLTEKDVKGLCN